MPRGSWTEKRERQYEHIKAGYRQRGVSETEEGAWPLSCACGRVESRGYAGPVTRARDRGGADTRDHETPGVHHPTYPPAVDVAGRARTCIARERVRPLRGTSAQQPGADSFDDDRSDGT